MLYRSVPDRFTDIERQILALFSAPVSVAVTDPAAPRSAEFTEEAECLVAMRAIRRREFLAGRAALRAAMAGLGLPPQPIPMNVDRSPCLPAGLCASLSHSDTLCVAVADRESASAALGIDVELPEPLDPTLLDTVCTRAERARLAELSETERGLAAKRIFSAKEAAYKCQFTLSGVLLDFDAFDIALLGEGRFEATFRQQAGPFATGDRISGHVGTVADHIVSTARIPG